MAKKKIEPISLTYEQQKCIICKKVYVSPMIISMQNLDKFILCYGCAKDLRKVTEFLAEF